jgi:hypothetical protein
LYTYPLANAVQFRAKDIENTVMILRAAWIAALSGSSGSVYSQFEKSLFPLFEDIESG